MKRADAPLLMLLLLTACQSLGNVVQELLAVHPPASLDELTLASDARLDSLGRVGGSLVGEGTSRTVHLISSDTSLISALAQRYRPDLARNGGLWRELSRLGSVTLPVRADTAERAASPFAGNARVGSPAGHTRVRPLAIRLYGDRCGGSEAQAEFVVEPAPRGGPALRGPVIGSFWPEVSAGTLEGSVTREPIGAPSTALSDTLLARARRLLDSLAAEEYRPGTLTRPAGLQLELNSLADVDAADLVPFRGASGVRYAVALRERRVSERGDTLLLAGVVVTDSAGAWRQVVFQPTLLKLRRGALLPYQSWKRPLFWRRLEAVSDFSFSRDLLWLEQEDVAEHRIRWGLIEPAGNVIVAAADADGGPRC